MKTIIIYHRADFDGIFCREIARKFLPDAELIGWDYGDKPLPFPDKDTKYYVLDLSMDKPFGLRFEDGWLARDNPIQSKDDRQIMPIDRIDWKKQWVWLDHHKTSIETHPSCIPGVRIDGVAACRLVWQWFFHESGRGDESEGKPWAKEDYVERRVTEPLAVRLAGEYDIWDKRDPDAELFQHGLRSQDITDEEWEDMLSEVTGDNDEDVVSKLLGQGRAVQYAKTKENESIIKATGWTIQFEGFCLLACNAARYNSKLFAAGLKPEHDGCLGFNWDGQKKAWRVSLYTDKPGIDLSTVAVKYGGGGHRGACGFIVPTLPFQLG